MTAASARRSISMRAVLATVPLPTGVACAVTAWASAWPCAAKAGAKRRKAWTSRSKLTTYSSCARSRRRLLASSFFWCAGSARVASISARACSM
jgi:hypothetical protein